MPLLLDAKFDTQIWDELGELMPALRGLLDGVPDLLLLRRATTARTRQERRARPRLGLVHVPEFAEVAHGQNFREPRASRVRYRYYHKQWGYLSKLRAGALRRLRPLRARVQGGHQPAAWSSARCRAGVVTS